MRSGGRWRRRRVHNEEKVSLSFFFVFLSFDFNKNKISKLTQNDAELAVEADCN